MNMKQSISARLLELLAEVEGEDVEIVTLYSHGMQREDVHLQPRQRQQALGKYISRINKKLKVNGQAIVPGFARGTYRLIDKRA